MLSHKFWQRALVFALILMGAMLSSSIVEAQTPEDPVLRHPLFAYFAKINGKDWERKGLHPLLQVWVKYQRIIGTHALITGYSDQLATRDNPNPQFTIAVTNWDKTNLFSSGLPRTHDNGKPIEIIDLSLPKFLWDVPKVNLTAKLFGPMTNPERNNLALDQFNCTYERPAQGGLKISNIDNPVAPGVYRVGTLGGSVIGQGSPTISGWKYLIGSAHVLLYLGGSGAGNRVFQPGALPVECDPNTPNTQLGSVGGIPGQPIPQNAQLRAAATENNPNLVDATVGYLVNDGAMVADIHGIGKPAGEWDPPVQGWCGNKTGFKTGTTQGCNWLYPYTVSIQDDTTGISYWYGDTFLANNWIVKGDSGSLWFDYDRRVHGMLIGGTVDGVGYTHGVYGRWQHVKEVWNVTINTVR